MSASGKHQSSSPCVPEKVLKRIFDLINQVRQEYNIPLLIFSKELSFLAGEHACNMSTHKIPVGHDGFAERQAQAVLVTAFTENIANIEDSQDPGQDTVLLWLDQKNSFSRIIANYTHTGIGVAESENGAWYCTQILATYKTHLSHKDKLLLMTRFINRFRAKKQLPACAVSMAASANFKKYIKQSPEALASINSQLVKQFFPNCIESDCISEILPYSQSSFLNLFTILRENQQYQEIFLKDITDIGFYMPKVGDDMVNAVIMLAKCGIQYRKIPKIHHHYPDAFKMLQLINDYRFLHGYNLLTLSHQWCIAAQRHSVKMMKNECEIEIRSLARKVLHLNSESTVHCGVYIIPSSLDPLRELFLMWISNFKTKNKILSLDYVHFGFGISILNERYCYATKIIGIKMEQGKPPPVPPKVTYVTPSEIEMTSQYGCLTSSEIEDAQPDCTLDASTSFRLTG